MKVLVLTNKMPYPPRDGGSIASLNMLRAYESQGNEVSCLAMNTSKHRVSTENIPKELSNRIRFIPVRCRTSIRPCMLVLNFLFSKKPYIAMRFKQRNYARQLRELLLREDFDLVQMEGPYLAHYLRLIRSESSARIALRAHNVEHRIWSRKASNTRFFLYRFYFRDMARRLERYEARLVEAVDYLICISPEDESYFRTGRPQLSSTCIPTGIDMKKVQPGPLPVTKDLFYIGALDWIPNQEGLNWFLDEVFPLIHRADPDVTLHIAGRNAPSTFLKKLDSPGIKYHGEVADARAFMLEHYLMVVPLLSGSGMRIKILEGMALGRPIISTSMGLQGIPASSPDHLRVADSPADYASQTLDLLSSQKETEAMCERARKLVEKGFDTYELAGKLQAFINISE